MNRDHFKAFLWLRWRIRVNQLRRAGSLNFILFAIFGVSALIAAVGLLFTGFFVGWLALPKAPDYVRLLVWDGVVAVLLFTWSIGLLSELQRSESLAIDKFLHLPVSISGAFTINYLSSLFSLTLIVFVPGMIGLALGQVIAHGPAMLLALPLIASFLLAMTALTYHFQGWLAALMSNPRRRRTVIVVVTGSFILVAQAPQLINVLKPWKGNVDNVRRDFEEDLALNQRFNTKEIPLAEYQRESIQLKAMQKERRERESSEKEERLAEQARFLNMVVPLGWLPLGAADLAANRVLPALLATLAFTLIGWASLRRSYRTTIRLYTGHYSGGERMQIAKPVVAQAYTDKPRFLERKLPWVSEHASAVAFAGFRSLTRAPEAKMAMLAPIMMLIVLGAAFATTEIKPPDLARPLMVFAGSAVVFLSAIQLIGNQFGYDRGGFRAFVLSPMPRREILLGKNLSCVPLAMVPSILVLIVVGSLFPMRIDHYPAAILQSLSAFLLFCILANALSILTPMGVASGAMKASNVKFIPVLIQMCFLMLFPVIFVPVLVPYGVEVLLSELDVVSGWPISLALSIPLLALVIQLYRWALTVEGRWLSLRELKVLDVVTKTE